MTSVDPAADLLRVYLDPAEICQVGERAGYPFAWFSFTGSSTDTLAYTEGGEVTHQLLPIKDLIRERDGHRCLRCGHPFLVRSGLGRWSPCDMHCTHGGPVRLWSEFGRSDNPDLAPAPIDEPHFDVRAEIDGGFEVDAEWRILTVHHLNGIKHDCRWWNLVSLCQRCHLTIQGKVWMDRPWSKPHSEWFAPFAAGFYAWKYLDEELAIEETMRRLDELLELELTQHPMF